MAENPEKKNAECSKDCVPNLEVYSSFKNMDWSSFDYGALGRRAVLDAYKKHGHNTTNDVLLKFLGFKLDGPSGISEVLHKLLDEQLAAIKGESKGNLDQALVRLDNDGLPAAAGQTEVLDATKPKLQQLLDQEISSTLNTVMLRDVNDNDISVIEPDLNKNLKYEEDNGLPEAACQLAALGVAMASIGTTNTKDDATLDSLRVVTSLSDYEDIAEEPAALDTLSVVSSLSDYEDIAEALHLWLQLS